MSRRQILLVAALAATLLGGGILGTTWILRQPVSPSEPVAPSGIEQAAAPMDPAVAAEEPEMAAGEGADAIEEPPPVGALGLDAEEGESTPRASARDAKVENALDVLFSDPIFDEDD